MFDIKSVLHNNMWAWIVVALVKVVILSYDYFVIGALPHSYLTIAVFFLAIAMALHCHHSYEHLKRQEKQKELLNG